MNAYLSLYFAFLRGEIPHVVQILTFAVLASLALPAQPSSLATLLACAVLLYLFLTEQARRFLIEQVRDQFSSLNVGKLREDEVAQRWQRYAFFTALIVSFLAAGIDYLAG